MQHIDVGTANGMRLGGALWSTNDKQLGNLYVCEKQVVLYGWYGGPERLLVSLGIEKIVYDLQECTTKKCRILN